jgi:DNA-binding NtrC family response regulator
MPVILMTGHSTVQHAILALKEGATDYLPKPFELHDAERRVLSILQRTTGNRLRASSSAPAGAELVVGDSRATQALRRFIVKIAQSPASTLLLTGESGTGKDLAAHAIHAESNRHLRPFVNITCSALPSQLLESELFGHERGAFTDAKRRKLGLFEQADGGTLFLDEIGEMELAMQAKLLRFLESKHFRRVGGHEDLHSNVRIVAATNVNLTEAVRSGRFREDLYYRLAVVTMRLPALRERPGDIPVLASHFLALACRKYEKAPMVLSASAMRLLTQHSWPGNVRELRNAMERATLFAEGPNVSASDLPFLTPVPKEQSALNLPESGLNLRRLERSLVEQALERTGGNQTRAARLLGLNRDQIRYRIQRYRDPATGGAARDDTARDDTARDDS